MMIMVKKEDDQGWVRRIFFSFPRKIFFTLNIFSTFLSLHTLIFVLNLNF